MTRDRVRGMKTIHLPILTTILDLFRSRAVLHVEILALRQQLAMVTVCEPKRPVFVGPSASSGFGSIASDRAVWRR
jgi:hypothetical protein